MILPTVQGSLEVDILVVDLQETSQLRDTYMAVSGGLGVDRKDDHLAAAVVVAAECQTLKILASCLVKSFF